MSMAASPPAGRPGVLKMQGKEVFRHAVEKLSETAETALQKAGLTADDVAWIVPHQANLRIITRTARRWAWAWTASW
jgi:3-oxoacyl-[acyl-carrier-protein] synthase-3